MVRVLGFFVLVVVLLVVAVDREAVAAKDAVQAVVVIVLALALAPALVFEEDNHCTVAPYERQRRSGCCCFQGVQ